MDLAALRGYWAAVSDRTVEVVPTVDLATPVDRGRLARAADDGAAASELAPWLDDFFADRTGAWFLCFLGMHNSEHIIGEALAVRGQAGVPLGL